MIFDPTVDAFEKAHPIGGVVTEGQEDVKNDTENCCSVGGWNWKPSGIDVQGEVDFFGSEEKKVAIDLPADRLR